MKNMHQRAGGARVRLLVASVAVVALGLVGCSSPSPGGSSSPQGTDALTVSYIGSGTATLPLFIAEDKGYFEEEGLEVTGQSFGTAPYPQAVAGEVDIVSGDHIGAFQVATGGLPLVFLTETSQLIPGNHQFVTPTSTGLTKPEDLKGARIGMSNLVGSAKFALDAMLEEAGLTEEDVEISQIALDALGPALELGNIDVAHLPGTFLDAAREAQDLTTIVDFADLPGLDGLPQAGYYTTQAAYQKDPEKFKRFVDAYHRASQDALDDTDMLTEVFIQYSKMDPAVADRLPLPSQVTESDPAALQKLADMAFKVGLLDKKLTVGEGSLVVADFIE